MDIPATVNNLSEATAMQNNYYVYQMGQITNWYRFTTGRAALSLILSFEWLGLKQQFFPLKMWIFDITSLHNIDLPDSVTVCHPHKPQNLQECPSMYYVETQITYSIKYKVSI